MARLLVENGQEAGMVYHLKEDAVTMGRSAASTIQVVDKRVSRHHAVLRRNRETFVAEDLGSKNGTYLNDQPLIGRTRLKSGDRIQLGDTTLVFEREPDDAGGRAAETRSGAVKLVPQELATRREEVKVGSAPSIHGAATIKREVLHDPLERLKVLYQVADNIRSELDLQELLRKIMDSLWSVLTPHRGVILLRDETEQTLEPVVVRTSDGDTQEINISRSVVERAMREEVAILISDAPSDVRFGASDSIISSRVKSAICVPLIAKGEVLGVIYLDAQEPGCIFYTNDELELVTGIGNQAAVAIVNAQLYQQRLSQQRLEKEIEIARSIQANLLPRTLPKVPGLELAAISYPAYKVGGDYYDFIPLQDGRLVMVIADASGKGVAAALLTSTIRAALRMETQHAAGRTVGEIISAINLSTCRDSSNNLFVTMVYAIYDPATKTLEYTNAGHNPPLIFRDGNRYRELDKGGCFLGIMEEVQYEVERVQLDVGDTVVFYTDGLTDMHNVHGQLFGLEKAIAAAQENLELTPKELCDEIHEAALQFRGAAEQFDDLTIVAAKLI